MNYHQIVKERWFCVPLAFHRLLQAESADYLGLVRLAHLALQGQPRA
jgi:hypothetical protein